MIVSVSVSVYGISCVSSSNIYHMRLISYMIYDTVALPVFPTQKPRAKQGELFEQFSPRFSLADESFFSINILHIFLTTTTTTESESVLSGL